MRTYRVWAECLSYIYLDVEAESKENALKIARETDDDEFEMSDYCDFKIISANKIEIDENGNKVMKQNRL